MPHIGAVQQQAFAQSYISPQINSEAKQKPEKEEIYDRYTTAITGGYEKFKNEYNVFKEKAAVYHKNEQCFGEELAREALAARDRFDLQKALASGNSLQENPGLFGIMTGLLTYAMEKYLPFAGPKSYEDLIEVDKTPEEIAYNAFKTDGEKLGLLKSNDVDTSVAIWEAAKSKGNVGLYPEAIDQHVVDCIKSQAEGKLTKAVILAAYDVCVPKQTPFKITASA